MLEITSESDFNILTDFLTHNVTVAAGTTFYLKNNIVGKPRTGNWNVNITTRMNYWYDVSSVPKTKWDVNQPDGGSDECLLWKNSKLSDGGCTKTRSILCYVQNTGK